MLELSNSSEKNFVGHTHISTNAYMWENVDSSKMRGRDGVGVIAYVLYRGYTHVGRRILSLFKDF